MNLTKKYDKFMQFIYDEYNRKQAFQRNGESGSVLVARFEHAFHIKFVNDYEDASVKEAAIKYLYEQGWIETVWVNGSPRKLPITFAQRIKPTRQGMLYVEEKRKSFIKRFWREIYESTIAGIIRGKK